MYRRLVLGCNDKILLISNVMAKCRFIDGVCKFCDAHHLGLRRWGETMNFFVKIDDFGKNGGFVLYKIH